MVLEHELASLWYASVHSYLNEDNQANLRSSHVMVN